MKANEWIGPLVVIVGLCLIAAMNWWITGTAIALLAVVVLRSMMQLLHWEGR